MNGAPDPFADFERALAFSFQWEVGASNDGGYTNDPDDPGGETKWSITQRDHPELDIRALTREQARDILIADYWLSSGRQRSCCDRLPWPLNAVHFDCTMNIGNWKRTRDGEPLWTGKANQLLQRALNVEDDGYLGPLTLRAARDADPARAALRAIRQRDLYYATLGSWAAKYTRGWHNRTFALRKLVGPVAQPEIEDGDFEHA